MSDHEGTFYLGHTIRTRSSVNAIDAPVTARPRPPRARRDGPARATSRETARAVATRAMRRALVPASATVVPRRARASERRRGDASRARGVRRGARVTSEIRTRDAVERAASELGISVSDARDERKLKRAFRAAALRTHPDIAGTRSAEAFKATQAAYRALRAAALETEGDALGAAALEEDDAEWAEHDWRWRSRMARNGDAETSRRKTEEERAAEVRARLDFMKAQAAGEAQGPARKRGKRVIKPISQQRLPTAEEIAAMEKEVKSSLGKGQASRSSMNGAHDVLSAQLNGLHRVSRLKAKGDADMSDIENSEKYATHYTTIKQIEDSEEERFLRLAKLAKEWRAKQAQWRYSGSTQKMTPKELLQAAVQGASLGACA